MKILYHMPSLSTLSAGRTIYFGYKHAFEDLGHAFYTLTSAENQKEEFERISPDIFISSLSDYSLKFLDITAYNKQRKKGMRAFMSTHAWNSPISRTRLNEPSSLKNQLKKVEAIKRNELGDVFFNPFEQGDKRMEGFKIITGYDHTTILLAADRIILYPEIDKRFTADISFIGTYLPDKRNYFKDFVFPLKKNYDLKLYGQDWTPLDRLIGIAQKGGQYLNIPILRSIQKAKLRLEDERKIYASSVISINIHEEYQRKFGGDCNERTFKIPLAGGFEITDDVACIRKYFVEGKEIVIAGNKADWFDKIAYYMKNPDKRKPIIEAGKKKVLNEHTYHNRVAQIVDIYSTIK